MTEKEKNVTITVQGDSAFNTTQASGADYGTSGSHQGSMKETLEEAKQTALDTGEQIKEHAVERAKTALSSHRESAVNQIQELAQVFRQTGENLREHDQNAIAQYADQAADQVERFSGYLRDKDLSRFKNEVEGFARQRPGVFLWSAFAAGFMLVRFLKSSGSEAGAGHGMSQSFSSDRTYSGSTYASHSETYPVEPESLNVAADNVLPVTDYDVPDLSSETHNVGEER